jgi:hypothetical protein
VLESQLPGNSVSHLRHGEDYEEVLRVVRMDRETLPQQPQATDERIMNEVVGDELPATTHIRHHGELQPPLQILHLFCAGDNTERRLHGLRRKT